MFPPLEMALSALGRSALIQATNNSRFCVTEHTKYNIYLTNDILLAADQYNYVLFEMKFQVTTICSNLNC